MAVSLADLGEKAREQAMIKIAIEEARRRRNAARAEPGEAGGNRDGAEQPPQSALRPTAPPSVGELKGRGEAGETIGNRGVSAMAPSVRYADSSAAGTAYARPECGGALERAREDVRSGGNKLHAKKVRGCLKDGTPHTFDSVREFDRYQELALMEKAGEIANLRTQVRYELIPAIRKRDGTLERATGYIADFVYEKDGETVVEDAKGYRNPKSAVYRVFALKRKLMLLKYGIEVKET